MRKRWGIARYYALLALLNFEGGLPIEARQRIKAVFEAVGLKRKDEGIKYLLTRMKNDGLIDPVFRVTEKGRQVLELYPEIDRKMIRESNKLYKKVYVEIELRR
jgi:DNA-binding PadR family transcriptional regulator